jgi:hypothetical protein
MVPTPQCKKDEVTKLVLSLIPSSKLLSTAASELSYVMPLDQVAQFSNLFAALGSLPQCSLHLVDLIHS